MTDDDKPQWVGWPAHVWKREVDRRTQRGERDASNGRDRKRARKRAAKAKKRGDV